MAKIPKKLVNFRLPSAIIYSIQEMAEVLSVSQSEVVEQAVILFESHQRGNGQTAHSPIAAVQTSTELQAMINAKQGHEYRRTLRVGIAGNDIDYASDELPTAPRPKGEEVKTWA